MTTKFFSDLLTPRKEQQRFPPLGAKFKEFLEKPGTACPELETSPACRYFTHEDGKHTGRTTTRSTKYTLTRRKASSTHLNNGIDSGVIWELQERMDSFNIRYENLKKSEKSFEGFCGLTEVCSANCSEVFKTVKIHYPELGQVLSMANESVFKLTKDLIELYNEEKQRVKALIDQMNLSKKEVIEKCEKIKEQYLQLTRLRTIEELNIDEELKKIFPDTSEEVNLFKERVLKMREIKPEATVQVLKDVCKEMNRERVMPEEPVADFEGMDPELVAQGIKGNYQVIITKTIKNVKKGMKATVNKVSVSGQTEGVFIDSKVFEELSKTLEKTLIINAGINKQLEQCRTDLKAAQGNIEKLESEKSVLRVEVIGAKKDLENRMKDIMALRNEVESKKGEVMVLNKVLTDKSKEVEHKEKVLRISEHDKHEVKKMENREEVGKIVEEVEGFKEKVEEMEKMERIEHRKRIRAMEVTKEKGVSSKALTKNENSVKEELDKRFSLQFMKMGVKRSEADVSETSKVAVETPENGLLNVNIHTTDLDEPKSPSSPNTKEKKTGTKDQVSAESFSITLPKSTKKSKLKKKILEEKHSNPSVSVQIQKKSQKKSKNKEVFIEKIEEENSEKYDSPLLQHSQAGRSESRTRSMNTDMQNNEISAITEEVSERKGVKTEDKACGLDIHAEVSIGIQVGNDLEKKAENFQFKLKAVNPNNIYGLRGDVFYQGSQFVAQPKLPDTVYSFN